mgnify:CR=1 FL=1
MSTYTTTTNEHHEAHPASEWGSSERLYRKGRPSAIENTL